MSYMGGGTVRGGVTVRGECPGGKCPGGNVLHPNPHGIRLFSLSQNSRKDDGSIKEQS